MTQYKTEADKAIEKYKEYCLGRSVPITNTAIFCAIQDRQSVLDLAKRLRSNSMSASSIIIDKEIQSLANQIEYLKSKL